MNFFFQMFIAIIYLVPNLFFTVKINFEAWTIEMFQNLKCDHFLTNIILLNQKRNQEYGLLPTINKITIAIITISLVYLNVKPGITRTAISDNFPMLLLKMLTFKTKLHEMELKNTFHIANTYITYEIFLKQIYFTSFMANALTKRMSQSKPSFKYRLDYKRNSEII